MVRVTKQLLLEPQSVFPVKVATRAKGLVPFKPFHEPAKKECLPAKVIEKALPKRLFFNLVTSTLTRPDGWTTQGLRRYLRRYWQNFQYGPAVN